ncbi:MAG: baseplate J/gp47 family protein [Eubacterium sp.]
MKTYNDILTAMKKAFFDSCGRNVENMGDIDARFQAVASELFSLGCKNDFLLRQAFPQTATGTYLDSHAAMRDMVRHTGTNAHGILTFAVSQPAVNDISIPKGIICSLEDKPFIQYITDAACTIAAGTKSAEVSATALEIGSQYNCPKANVTRMVNAPTGVETVTNLTEFEGGSDNESDELLRRRIMDSFRLGNGISTEYVEALVMKLPYVIDCKISILDDHSVYVWTRTTEGKVTQKMKEEIDDSLQVFAMINEDYAIKGSYKKSFDIKVDAIRTNADADAIKALVTSVCSGLRINENLDLDYLEYRLSELGDCRVTSPTQVGRYVICNNGGYLGLQNCEVLMDG